MVRVRALVRGLPVFLKAGFVCSMRGSSAWEAQLRATGANEPFNRDKELLLYSRSSGQGFNASEKDVYTTITASHDCMFHLVVGLFG